MAYGRVGTHGNGGRARLGTRGRCSSATRCTRTWKVLALQRGVVRSSSDVHPIVKDALIIFDVFLLVVSPPPKHRTRPSTNRCVNLDVRRVLRFWG